MRATLFILLLLSLPVQAADYHGPWIVKDLQQAPRVEFEGPDGPLRKLYYPGEPLAGKPTRVFAYLAKPEKIDGKLPAMVLVHGGGGTAFKEWAELWAKRGYVALAMDLGGAGPDKKRLPDGMPDQGDVSKFPREPKPLKDIWSYHAVAAVIRGVSLLANLSEVDANKIGITGISWGGYLTCIVMGLDDRLKVAVPVYGCGFIYHNSAWIPTFEKLPGDWRKEWVQNFDPSKYAGQAKMPVLFVNGTNDFAYPLDSYQKTYRLVKDRTLCVTVNMPHSHPAGWAPKEIGFFVDSHLKGGTPLWHIAREPHVQELDGRKFVQVGLLQLKKPAVKAVQFHWTTDVGEPWSKRKWQSKVCPASPGNATDFYQAELPKGPAVWFMTATDERGATVSTEHHILEK